MTINLLESYQRFKAQHGSCRLPLVSPFYSIVGKYSAILTRVDAHKDISGIEIVLQHEMARIHWWSEIFRIPIHRRSLPCFKTGELKDYELISGSLLQSIGAYKTGLKDKESGLSYCIQADLARGLFLAADWASRGVPLDEQENPFIVIFPSQDEGYED